MKQAPSGRSSILARLLSAIQSGWVLFFLALFIRVSFLLVLHSYMDPEDERVEGVRIAETLASTGAFANPYHVPSGPTAITAPAFPFLLSLVYRVFNPGLVDSTTRELAKRCFMSLISAAQYGLLPWLAAGLCLPRLAGGFAGLIGAVIPLFFYYETSGTWEAPMISVLLIVLTGWSSQLYDRRAGPSIKLAILCGAGLLLAPSTAISMAAFVLILAFHAESPRIWRQLGAFVLICFAIVTPWIVRNHQRLNAWFWIRDNVGLELWVSNNPNARPLFPANRLSGSYALHPYRSNAAAATVRDRGEVAYFSGLGEQARNWIAEHPADFLRLTLQRFFYFWFPPLRDSPRTAYFALLTIAGFLGLGLARRSNAVLFLGTLWASYSPAYYIVQVDQRYRYPIVFGSLLLAGHAIVIWMHHTGGHFGSGPLTPTSESAADRKTTLNPAAN